MIENKEVVKSTKKTSDNMQNLATGLGTDKSKASHDTWNLDTMNNWHQLESVYQSNWIAGRIVDVHSEDMTREWRTIKSDGAEDIKQLEEHLMIKTKTQDALQWARLYGGAGMLMVTNQDMKEPLDINKIKKGDLQKVIVFT